MGEAAQKAFITLFVAILRAQNTLTSLDEIAGHGILTERLNQDYHGVCISLGAEFGSGTKAEKQSINDERRAFTIARWDAELEAIA